MFKNLIDNWKTTSAGLGVMAASVVHLIFAVKAKTADENTWTTAFIAVISGIGLIAAGDAGKSATKEDLQQVKQEADTVFLKKTDIPKP